MAPRLGVDKIAQDGQVVETGVEGAIGGLAIATGATDLLGQVLEALGQVVMVDATDIGLVDPHAKSDSGHDNHPVGSQEGLLHGAAILARHPGVVMPRVETGHP